MYLIVGLGNPGEEYKNNRHNVGFMVVDHFLSDCNYKQKLNCKYSELTSNSEKVYILKPMSFMNLSGKCVSDFIKYFNVSVENILVVYDDMDLPFGTFKLREKGGHGGHNGMRDIINHLGTNEFKRLRVGISHGKDSISHVLSDFSKKEKKELDHLFLETDKLLKEFGNVSFSNLMNKFNV